MKASEGPSPLAMAASTSREVVTWMVSETLWVWSHFPPGRCSTKPRSVWTGPPRKTGCAAMYSVVGSSFICESTSESRIGSGLLRTMPSAPFSVCSQMRATVCAKLGSDRDGIAMSRWFVRLFCALSANGELPIPGTPVTVMFLPPMPQVWGCAAEGSRNGCYAATPCPLPFVDKTQHLMLARQFRGERIKRRCQLQGLQRGIVQLNRAAAAPDDSPVQGAVGGNAH